MTRGRALQKGDRPCMTKGRPALYDKRATALRWRITMRKLLLATGLVLGLCAPLAAGVGAGEKRDLKAIDKVFREPVNMNASADDKMHVLFRHSDHKGMQCEVCHHNVTPAGERYVACGSDAACHALEGKSVDLKSRFMAYHDRESDRSCYGCHFIEKARFDNVKGCTTCHQQLAQAK